MNASLRGQSVDDTISSRVHEPHAPRDTVSGEDEYDHHPESDVERIRIHPVEGRSQVHVQRLNIIDKK